MKSNSFILVLALFLFVQFTACTSISQKDLSSYGLEVDSLKAAEALIDDYLSKGELAGFSALVIKDDQEVFRITRGYADKEANKAMEENTIFRIFSMTKPVTAAALMVLYDEGKFKLDDKVSKYIPEFAGLKVYTPNDVGFTLEAQMEEMTIRHLLTHTSGLSYGWNPESYVDSLYREKNVSGWNTKLEENVRALSSVPLNFQPGTQWLYGLSIDVAGYLVEVLSGVPLDNFMKDRLFSPLKMDDTGFFVPQKKQERLCGLYDQKEGEPLKLSQGIFKEHYNNPVIHFSGGGGLVSTIDDYARFCRMLLNEGELNGVRVLQPETAKLIMSNHLPGEVKYRDGKMGYGLAGAVDLESGEYAWSGMASTSFWINPSTDMIIITCTQILPMNLSYGMAFKKKVEGAVVVE